jgi:hypothetical protein
MTAPDTGSFPEALERRPVAREFKVEVLLYELGQGRMRIPPFQRPLRWERQDAMRLIDSIYRGYPVGTLLFWETKAEAGEVRIGPYLSFSAKARSDALWVVDGQQRIVSLARVLLSDVAVGDDFFLYFDLDQQEFIFASGKTDKTRDPGRWLPMNEVLDAERLMQWLLDNAGDIESKDRRNQALRLGKRIRDYEMPAYLVRTEKEQILREVFSRINESGKKLKASEVFDALHGAQSQARPGTLKEIARALDSLGFGRIDEDKVLYRLLLVLQGKDIDGIEVKEATELYSETSRAARRAIEFIINDAQIPHYQLLPYKQPLVTLGKFFYHHREPGIRSRELLSRWVWRGALSGVHRGDTASTRLTLDRIIADDEEQSVQRLLEQVEEGREVRPELMQPFNFRSAVSKLLTLALLSIGPLDLESGQPIQPGQLVKADGKKSGFHIPQLVTTSRELLHAKTVVNRIFHPGQPGIRRVLLKVTDSAVLRSHGITDQAFEALLAGNMERFFHLRAAYLQPLFDRFFDRQTRRQESDRPSLNSLLIRDEDE